MHSLVSVPCLPAGRLRSQMPLAQDDGSYHVYYFMFKVIGLFRFFINCFFGSHKRVSCFLYIISYLAGFRLAVSAAQLNPVRTQVGAPLLGSLYLSVGSNIRFANHEQGRILMPTCNVSAKADRHQARASGLLNQYHPVR